MLSIKFGRGMIVEKRFVWSFGSKCGILFKF